MSFRKAAFALLCLAALLAPAPSAGAEAKPAWLLSVTAMPTHFAPGAVGTDRGGPSYLLVATNVGSAPTTGSVTLTDTLPEGITPTSTIGGNCALPVGQVVTCTETGVNPGEKIEVNVIVDVDPTAKGSNKASVQGGGAAGPVTVETPTTISPFPPPFGFLPGFQAPLSEEDGSPASLAGSHPYQLTSVLGVPTEKPAGGLGGAGHLRDASIDFPAGQIVNPTATPVLCTEAELTSEGLPGCPAESQIGLAYVTTVAAANRPQAYSSPLYNMVPPPGEAAMLGFDALGSGIFVHLGGGVRSDGDYGITGEATDALALVNNPVFGAQVQLWGDPSAKSHDEMRGDCFISSAADSCPVPAQPTALLTLPVHCTGQPDVSVGKATSWEHPDVFVKAQYESAALDGTPVSTNGCNQLGFEPEVGAQPTTNLTDSPSGLDFTLRQPQDTKLGGPGSPTVAKDVTATFPAGMVVNPSAAGGQDVCSPAEIGLTTALGQAAPIHFSKAPPSCPNASKIGTLEASTPLLAQIDSETHEVMRDPGTGEVIPRPVPGSIYLAEPFRNPFGSLLAAYLSVEDLKSGTYAKLAVRAKADPLTGQLTTELTESPQLPIAEAKLHVFEGPRASFRTPPACATNTTTAQLVPWAAPEVPPTERTDSFQTTQAPGGGPCPSAADGAPNHPGFVAGTLAPVAGAYSPFVMRLTREDGSQPIAGFEARLPAGLSAKLAGVPYCTEAEIAQAQARSNPEQGKLEQASPSCPAATQLGSLDVGAGAGPTPIHIGGRLYLAGPYKGAPLSAVAITPAVAGPFDLGTVLVRAPLYLDPTTAQARAVSDPLPTILEGIPADVRSVAIRIDRPQFTLNPTSCEPKSVAATTTSVFGQPAALSSPFQVGGCEALPFKPKFDARLFGPANRGAHPRLRAVLSAKPGEANIARTVLTLPRSEFIDQGHFRTICTRVQFAANQCPAGSIYGHIKATSPLLDYALQGPIYLRSSSQELPDVVLALRGPPHQPVAIDAVGHNDSVNGRLRVTFDAIPDAPLTKAIVTMQGASKGLFQNSTNICKGSHRATLKMVAQNGKVLSAKPLFRADCHKKKHKKGKGKKR